MKVYISVPINGQEDGTLEKKIERAFFYSNEVKRKLMLQGFEAITPFDCNKDYTNEGICIGNDISALLNCDAVYFCKGAYLSKGCRLECTAANLYDKKILKIEDVDYASMSELKDIQW